MDGPYSECLYRLRWILVQQVVTAADDSSIGVWDATTGAKQMLYTGAHGREEITALTLDDTGRRLITGARNGTIKVSGHSPASLQCTPIYGVKRCNLWTLATFIRRVFSNINDFSISGGSSPKKLGGYAFVIGRQLLQKLDSSDEQKRSSIILRPLSEKKPTIIVWEQSGNLGATASPAPP